MSTLVRMAALGLLFASVFCTGYSEALETDFGGRVQSTFVLRDINGFQYSIFDETKGVQWRNELKFDITTRPEYEEYHNLRLDKVFLSYRGAYDAIFDVLKDRDAWENDGIREKSPADFELGLDDIETENDLREAFVDFVAEASDRSQSAVLRIGRQIAQWGEADGFNVVNVLNPFDNSVLMFFENPDDLATPLWMGRLNYSRGSLGPLADIGVEFVVIPDIRPHQFAPLDDNMNAPYAFGFHQLSDMGFDAFRGLSINRIENVLSYIHLPQTVAFVQTVGADTALSILDPLVSNLDVELPALLNDPAYMAIIGQPLAGYHPPTQIQWRQDVPGSTINNTEYGVRFQAAYGLFTANLYYFHGFQDDPAMDFSHVFSDGVLRFTYPEQDMYGASFNMFLSRINAVLRGEGCMVDKASLVDLRGLFDAAFDGLLDGIVATGRGGPAALKGFDKKRVYQSLIAFDKNYWARWLNPNQMIVTVSQAYWRHIEGWEYDRVFRPFDEQDNFRFTFYATTDYLYGRIHPEIFFMYDTENVWMTMVAIKYTKDGNLYYKLTQMSFWGDPDGISPFTQPVDLTGTSEISFRVGYNF